MDYSTKLNNFTPKNSNSKHYFPSGAVQPMNYPVVESPNPAVHEFSQNGSQNNDSSSLSTNTSIESSNDIPSVTKATVSVERIQPARPHYLISTSSLLNGQKYKIDTDVNMEMNTLAPNDVICDESKCILENLCIMDKLPTQLPAYIASAPTACPAVKPSNPNIDLIFKSNQNMSIDSDSKSDCTSLDTQSIETGLLNSKSLSKHSSLSLTTSYSSVSTSPMSSISVNSSVCDLISMNNNQNYVIDDREQSSSQYQIEPPLTAEVGTDHSESMQNGDRLEDRAILTTQNSNEEKHRSGDAIGRFLNGESATCSGTLVTNILQDHQPVLAITEQTIIQDLLEAQFVPIDSEVSKQSLLFFCINFDFEKPWLYGASV